MYSECKENLGTLSYTLIWLQWQLGLHTSRSLDTFIARFSVMAWFCRSNVSCGISDDCIATTSVNQ